MNKKRGDNCVGIKLYELNRLFGQEAVIKVQRKQIEAAGFNITERDLPVVAAKQEVAVTAEPQAEEEEVKVETFFAG